MAETSSPSDSSYGSSSVSRTPNSTIRHRRRVVASATLLAVSLIVATVWLGMLFDRELTKLSRNSLHAILSANVEATRIWLVNRCREVDRLVLDPTIHGSAVALVAKYGDQGEPSLAEILDDESLLALAAKLDLPVLPSEHLGWVLLDPQGVVIGSNHERMITSTLAIPQEVTRRLNRGQTAICSAIRSPVPLTSTGPQSRSGGPIMLVMSPIRTGVSTVGSLAFVVDPVTEFSSILSVARTGQSGETYAFNRAGQMISQSRFEDQLRSAGILPADPDTSSVLNVEVRDPGANLTNGGRSSIERSSQPFTFMASMAIRGSQGENFDGYNDYRGVPVVGVWRWLDEYDFGMATETDVAEAYEATRLLERAVLGVLGLLTLASVGIMAITFQYRGAFRRAPKLVPGTRSLGQYSIGRQIGSGGMGTVHLGRHQLLKRDVAVKVLQGCEFSPRAIARFEREVQATAKLRHPNTIAIYEYGRTDNNEFFYVMEWVDGITLQQLIKEYGRQPPERVIYLLLQVCGSLSEAHHKNIVHRDVKPANIMITAHSGLYDTIKLLDFGLVKEVDSDSTMLTLTESFTGTPSYMSPEAVRDAAKVDHRSDIYSLGAVGYALLTGLPVFDGGSAVDICVKQLNEEPIRPSERIGERLPDDLQNVLMSCLRKFPEERPRSVDELAETLQHCADSARWSIGEARRWWEHVYQASDTLADVEPGHETLISGESLVIPLDRSTDIGDDRLDLDRTRTQ